MQAAAPDGWLEWILKGLGALLLMLVSIGIRDIRDKLRKIDELDKQYSVLYERVDNLATKIRQIQDGHHPDKG